MLHRRERTTTAPASPRRRELAILQTCEYAEAGSVYVCTDAERDLGSIQ